MATVIHNPMEEYWRQYGHIQLMRGHEMPAEMAIFGPKPLAHEMGAAIKRTTPKYDEKMLKSPFSILIQELGLEIAVVDSKQQLDRMRKLNKANFSNINKILLLLGIVRGKQLHVEELIKGAKEYGDKRKKLVEELDELTKEYHSINKQISALEAEHGQLEEQLHKTLDKLRTVASEMKAGYKSEIEEHLKSKLPANSALRWHLLEERLPRETGKTLVEHFVDTKFELLEESIDQLEQGKIGLREFRDRLAHMDSRTMLRLRAEGRMNSGIEDTFQQLINIMPISGTVKDTFRFDKAFSITDDLEEQIEGCAKLQAKIAHCQHRQEGLGTKIRSMATVVDRYRTHTMESSVSVDEQQASSGMSPLSMS